MNNPGVKQGGEGTPQAPVPGAAPTAYHMSPDTSQPAATAQGDNVDHPAVEYVRFKEVNDEKNDLKQEITRQQQQFAQERQQMMQQTQEIARVAQAQTNQPQTPAPQPLDESRKKFGDGEAGDQAHEAVLATVEAALVQRGIAPVNTNEIYSQVANLVDQKFGSMNTTMQQNSRLSGWQESGMYTQEEVGKIQGRMADLLKADSRWGQSVDRLVETANTQLLEAGEVRPYAGNSNRPSAPGTPLQPGPPSAPRNETKATKLARLRSEYAHFPSIARMDDETLLTRYGEDAGTAPTSDGMSPELIHGQYRGA